MNQNITIKNNKSRKHTLIKDITPTMNDAEKEEIGKQCFKI